MDASVVIPTKNGGDRFIDVLAMVTAQVTSFDYEVICVDSGSSDQTVDVIKAFPKAKLYQIPAEDFGHGKTRTWAAGKCSGKYIVFITQDALPTSVLWLQNFVDAMKEFPEAIAGFGAHVPYPECNYFDARDISGLFESYGNKNKVIQVDDLDRFKVDMVYRMGFAFFSDNNACVRRDLFLEDPYPDVSFAEDQFWMLKKMGEGYKKVYAPAAAVFHSHNYNLIELLQRAYDEHRALKRLFDWNPVPNGKRIPLSTLELSRADWSYIRSLPLSKFEKAENCLYSVFRNGVKLLGAHEGAVYDDVSPNRQRRMDILFSQYLRELKR